MVDLHRLTWRHHGLGMLQGELSPTCRIHIWHPLLRWVPREGYRDVHDHRFDLESTVLFGEVHDRRVLIEWTNPDDPRAVDCSAIRHAKIQSHNASDAEHLGKVIPRMLPERVFRAGRTYSIPRHEFHTTEVYGLTVTRIVRSNFSDRPARVLGKAESAIVLDGDPTLYKDIVRQATEALSAAFEVKGGGDV